MAQTPPISPRARDRALGMLRRLTVGAGAAAVLATAGLGVLAAATYPGTTATASASSSSWQLVQLSPASQSISVPRGVDSTWAPPARRWQPT